MAEQEVNVEETVAAVESDVSEETASSTEEKETVAAQPAKAESNPWKKLRDAKKDADARAKKAQAEADQLRKELEEAKKSKSSAKAEEAEPVESADEEEDPELPYDDKDLRLYILENGLSDLKAGIEEALTSFPGISLEKATQFAKATKPKESKSKTEIALKGSSAAPKGSKSTLKDVSAEDALKLSTEEYGKWLILNDDPSVSNVMHYGTRGR